VPQHQVKIVDTRSGAVLDDLPHASFNLKRTVDFARHDSMSVDVKLLGTDSRREAVTGLSYEPWKRSLCLVRDGAALWAGPLMTTGWGHDSVTFNCGGITQLLARRPLFLDTLAAELALSSSARDAIVTLLGRPTLTGTWALPLAPGALLGDAPVLDRTWAPTDVPMVYDAVKKLVDEDDAPDVRIDAVLDGNQQQLTWVARYGSPYLGVAEPAVAWDFPATIQEWTGDIDGTNMLTDGTLLGDGQEDERLVATQTNGLAADGWPRMLRTDRSTVSTRVPMVLQAQADSFVAVNAAPGASQAIKVDPEFPALRGWALGDNGKFRSEGHWFLRDGERVRRVTGYTLTDKTLELETMAPLAPYAEAVR